jgi:hypothetical protein
VESLPSTRLSALPRSCEEDEDDEEEDDGDVVEAEEAELDLPEQPVKIKVKIINPIINFLLIFPPFIFNEITI